MKPLGNFLASLGALLLLCAPLAAERVPMTMHYTFAALQAAQTSAQPAEDLKKARRHLHAQRKLTGFRADATRVINEAIAALEQGRRTEADALIKQAFTIVETGSGQRPGETTLKHRRKADPGD